MNRILYASDCLDVLLDRNALPDESVDLICLDPPFNSNSKYNLPFKGKYKTARPVEAFKDIWQWTDEDSEHLLELDSDPRTRPLATLIKFTQGIENRGGGEFSCRLPEKYGLALDGNATRAQAYRLYLSSL